MIAKCSGVGSTFSPKRESGATHRSRREANTKSPPFVSPTPHVDRYPRHLSWKVDDSKIHVLCQYDCSYWTLHITGKRVPML